MLKLIGTFASNQDNTIKSVFKNNDDETIEVSLLQNKDYDVVCVPTFHYCNLGCKMCHLTENVNKCMTPVIVDELMEAIARTVRVENVRLTDKKGLLISFMGVGEPLLNLKLIEHVYQNEECLKALGYDNICYSISTMMPVNMMDEVNSLLERTNIPLKIHYSLHTPNEEERHNLIPSSRVSVKESLEFLRDYKNRFINNNKAVFKYLKLHKVLDPVEIHYTLIDGINDSEEELTSLINYLKELNLSIKFIRFNELKDMFKSTKEELWIKRIKEETKVRVKSYNPPGKDIGSSCGDFTRHYYLEEVETKEEKERFDIWYKEHKVENPKMLIKRIG